MRRSREKVQCQSARLCRERAASLQRFALVVTRQANDQYGQNDNFPVGSEPAPSADARTQRSERQLMHQ